MFGTAAMGMHGAIQATEDIGMLERAEEWSIERTRDGLRAAYLDDSSVEETRDDGLKG